MYNIKKCPFCGGRPVIESSHRAFIDGKTTKVAFVRCSKCNARSGRVNLSDFNRTSYSTDANEKVVQAWNQRINPYQNQWNQLKEELIKLRDESDDYTAGHIVTIMEIREERIRDEEIVNVKDKSEKNEQRNAEAV